jgi:hypothetical protein
LSQSLLGIVVDQVDLKEVVALCELGQGQLEVAGDDVTGSFIELIQLNSFGITETRALLIKDQ